MKRYMFSLFSLTALIGLSLCLGVNSAFSIPVGQRAVVQLGQVSTSSSTHTIVPDTSVTVDNGPKSRECIITFSTEVLTSFGDRAEIAYSIDNDVCQIIGPAFFHHGAGGAEAVTQMGVGTIGAGTHTIAPCFRAVDLNGSGASTTFFFRHMTVECRTQ